MSRFTCIRTAAACIGLALGVGMGLTTNAISERQEREPILTFEDSLAVQREQVRQQELKVEGLEQEIGALEKLADVDLDKVTVWRHAHVPESSARLAETQRELKWEEKVLDLMREALKRNESNRRIVGQALSLDQQGKAVEALNKYGHIVRYSEGAGLSNGDGHVASLYNVRRTEGKGILAEDARHLSQISDLVEIRVLPSGGPPKEFWDNLGRVETLLDFAAHYGLNDYGLQGLAYFPNLRTLTIWGRSTHLSALPDLPKLRLLHVEETMINAEDIRRIEEACPQLEEFVCDDLDEEALKILKSITRIKNVSAGPYETGEETAQ